MQQRDAAPIPQGAALRQPFSSRRQLPVRRTLYAPEPTLTQKKIRSATAERIHYSTAKRQCQSSAVRFGVIFAPNDFPEIARRMSGFRPFSARSFNGIYPPYGIVVINVIAGCETSIRLCCATIGTSLCTRTAYGTPCGTVRPSGVCSRSSRM